MRFAANYLFTAEGEPIKNGYVETAGDGTIIEVGRLEEETPSTEFHNGIICPGFVNAHCHIELSHLKGKFRKGTGMSGFITQINELRESAPAAERIERIEEEMERLYNEGVSAMADISNCNESFIPKRESPIYTRTFIELFGSEPKDAEMIIDGAKKLLEEADRCGIDASITPHSPYTMSPELLGKASAQGLSRGYISYHNQESEEEEEMIGFGRGALHENYISRGLSVPSPTGRPALIHFLERLKEIHNPPFKEHILLIHNTVTGIESIRAAKEILEESTWVTCPLSNIFIHNRLAPLNIFREEGLRIAIGTDSLSSNDTLSMIGEMEKIQSSFPEIPLGEIIEWATINGAKALGQEGRLGTLTPGKRPGVVLIEGADLSSLKLRKGVTSRRLV